MADNMNGLDRRIDAAAEGLMNHCDRLEIATSRAASLRATNTLRYIAKASMAARTAADYTHLLGMVDAARRFVFHSYELNSLRSALAAKLAAAERAT